MRSRSSSFKAPADKANDHQSLWPKRMMVQTRDGPGELEITFRAGSADRRMSSSESAPGMVMLGHIPFTSGPCRNRHLPSRVPGGSTCTIVTNRPLPSSKLMSALRPFDWRVFPPKLVHADRLSDPLAENDVYEQE